MSEINKLKILIVGGGGREHAIGWKVKESPRAGEIFFAPGNGGTLNIGVNVDIATTDIQKLVEFAKKESIDLTLALPDDPLALGIVDKFQSEGLRIWGPTQAAAEIEWSKAYAKDFMVRRGIPTARFQTFSDYERGEKYLRSHPMPVVIKASGLAAGKGVTICKTYEEAREALENVMVKKIFGDGGNEVVIEEFLQGIEFSIHAFSDGKNFKLLPSAQDHKRIYEGNTGSNTGGMGTIAPLPSISEEKMKEVEEKIVAPAIAGLALEGRPFVGCLYPGIMFTNEGPKVIEVNARFGDPETQSYMRLLDTDLLDIVEASLQGTLDQIEIKWKELFACTIVLASKGYPWEYDKGHVISGVQDAETDPSIVIFHAGTATKEGKLITNGGRVLGVSATGKTLKEALDSAYQAASKISFEGMQYRKDIGKY